MTIKVQTIYYIDTCMYIHVMTMCMHLQAPEILLLDNNSSPTLRQGFIFLSIDIFEDLLVDVIKFQMYMVHFQC